MRSYFERMVQRVRRLVTAPGERGTPSGGWIPARVRKAVSPLVPEGAAVLEIGCGEGLLLEEVRQTRSPRRMVGADRSAEQVARARARLGASAEIRADVPAESFDVVMCVNVLQGLASGRERDDLLAACARSCRPGGTVIVEARNGWNPLLAVWYRGSPQVDSTLPSVLRADSPRAVADILRGAGLTVTGVRPVPSWLGPLALAVIVVAKKNEDRR